MNKYILTAACGLAFSAASAQTKALPDSPNILLILVDDLGYGDLSCQGAAKDIQTPHIDKLLKEGRANVKVLDTQDRWFGVTYKEDKESVQKAFEGLIKDGVYPADLWA